MSRSGRRSVAAVALVGALVAAVVSAAGCRAEAPVPPSADGSAPAATIGPHGSVPPGDAPVDFSGPGPYPVGKRTVPLEPTRCDFIPGSAFGCPQSAVVYYPADPERAGSARKITGYSSGVALPDTLRALAPAQFVQEVRFDIPVFDDPAANGEGPFPLVLHSHDMGSYLLFESRYLAHLASWGFVAVAPDHQERSMAGQLVKEPYAGDGADIDDLRRTLAALGSLNVSGTSLHGAIDLSHVAVSGHGVGGSVAMKFAAEPAVATYLALAPTALPDTVASDKPGLVVGGDADEHVPPADLALTYEALADRARLVMISRAGHNTFLDLCRPIHDRGGLTQFAAELPTFAELLRTTEDGCEPERIDPARAEAIVGHASVAHLRVAFGLDRTAVSLDEAFMRSRFGDALAATDAPG